MASREEKADTGSTCTGPLGFLKGKAIYDRSRADDPRSLGCLVVPALRSFILVS